MACIRLTSVERQAKSLTFKIGTFGISLANWLSDCLIVTEEALPFLVLLLFLTLPPLTAGGVEAARAFALFVALRALGLLLRQDLGGGVSGVQGR